jgi:hypothetical protein
VGCSLSIELTGGEKKPELGICSLVHQALPGITDDVMMHHWQGHGYQKQME